MTSFAVSPPCQKFCRCSAAPGCVGCTAQRSAFFSLPLWLTCPVAFFFPLWGRTRRLPPMLTAIPRCKRVVLELWSSFALSQLCHVQITLRCWRSTGMQKRYYSIRHVQGVVLSKRGWDALSKQGSRLWLLGGTETRMLNDCCLVFQVKTILGEMPLAQELPGIFSRPLTSPA